MLLDQGSQRYLIMCHYSELPRMKQSLYARPGIL